MTVVTAPAVETRKSRMILFLVLLALANLMWAGQGTAVKEIEPFWGNNHPLATTFLPFYVATILLIPLLLWKRRANPNAVRPTWADWKKFVAAGVAGQVVAQLGMTWGVLDSTASNSSVLNLLIPVITAVLASFMLRERLTPLRVVCLLIGLGGAMLMSVRDVRNFSVASSYLIGNLLIIAGCTGSAFYNVYCKGLLERFQEVEILIFSYVTATIVTLPLLLWRESDCFALMAHFDWQAWVAFAFLAVFMFGTSMLLFFYVLQYLPVTVASASLYLVPVFGLILAWLLLGDVLNPIAIIGAAVVLIATVLIMKFDPSASS